MGKAGDNGTSPERRTRIAAFSVRMRGGVPSFAQCAGCGGTWGPDQARDYERFVADHTSHTKRPS